jgi:hypothetical protein
MTIIDKKCLGLDQDPDYIRVSNIINPDPDSEKCMDLGSGDQDSDSVNPDPISEVRRVVLNK